jgi:hypothetical protein
VTFKRWAPDMRAVFKRLLLFAIASAVAILGAIAVWIYPDLSSFRAIFAASANSTPPPSTSFSAVMICSSVNLFRFRRVSPSQNPSRRSG